MQVHFFLPKELCDRIDKAAEYIGLNRTQFFKNSALAEASEILNSKREQKLNAFRVSARVKHDEGTAPALVEDGPMGLGLSDLLLAPCHDTTEGAPKAEDPVSRLAQAIVERLGTKRDEEPPKKSEALKPTGSGLLEKLARLLP